MKVMVIINKAHNLMADQVRAIKDRFPECETFDMLLVPESGWTLPEIVEVADALDHGDVDCIVFASPIPALILIVSRLRGNYGIYALHNDKRVAKEIRTSEGTVKIIHTVAPDGWEIV